METVTENTQDDSEGPPTPKNGYRNISCGRSASIDPRSNSEHPSKISLKSKSGLVKINGQICKPNYTKQLSYSYNQEVVYFENIHTEFKHFTALNITTVTGYVCAYLNSYGGKMFFGINDDGFVKGIHLTRKDIDDFQVQLDIALRNFTPRVMPDQVKLDFHEVAVDQNHTYIVLDRYVVEISVFCHSYNKFYTTHEGLFLIKRNGSINHLSASEIVQYIISKYNPMITHESFAAQINPIVLQRMSREDLDRLIVNLQRTLEIARDYKDKLSPSDTQYSTQN